MNKELTAGSQSKQSTAGLSGCVMQPKEGGGGGITSDACFGYGGDSVFKFHLEGGFPAKSVSLGGNSAILDVAVKDGVIYAADENAALSVLDCDTLEVSRKEQLLHEDDIAKAALVLRAAAVNRSEPDKIAFITAQDSTLRVRLCGEGEKVLLKASLPGANDGRPKLKWADEETVLCSWDTLVIVFRIQGDVLREVFRHDGHGTRVADFAPHPTVRNLVFSSDASKSLHAWLFNEESSDMITSSDL